MSIYLYHSCKVKKKGNILQKNIGQKKIKIKYWFRVLLVIKKFVIFVPI